MQMNDQFVIPLNAMNNFPNGKYLPTKPTTIIDQNFIVLNLLCQVINGQIYELFFKFLV